MQFNGKIITIQRNLSNPTHQGIRGNMSDCTGCEGTRVLFWLTEILGHHKFFLDVTGCRKSQVSDCTSSTVFEISVS
jgi:hypothetical protein